MDGGGYGGGGLSAPPMSGLGNYKGVMLCNRPSDSIAPRGGGGDGPAPFKAMSAPTANDQLGLQPCKSSEEQPNRGVKKRGSSAALRQHVRWLRELQQQMRGEREQVEDEEKTSEERKLRMRSVNDKHREAVRTMMADRNEAAATQAAAKKAHPPADTAVKAVAAPRSKGNSKPLWAMTEKEKEDFEDMEADDLLNFASGLDYDKYCGDLEFKQGVEALKDRTGKIQKEQEAFKNALVRDFNAMLDDDEEPSTACGSPRSLKLDDGLDGQSLLGDQRSEYSTSTRRSRAGEERYGGSKAQDWDSSTACGEDRPRLDAEMQDAASAVLESAPHIRAVHSKSSVQKLIERAKAQDGSKPTTAIDLVEAMRRDGPTQAPVITSSFDTQQRVHKPTDPSNLPYLYRSPAV